MARVIAGGVAHHVTQRGNARRTVFDSDSDRLAYLQLLRHYSVVHKCVLVGYCLMSNHVHLIAIPGRSDSLPLTLRDTHGRYATYLNGRQCASGHVWQGRYFSCPLDRAHLWAALRYVELNPVRAGMVARPDEHSWSSAAAHSGASDESTLIDVDFWKAEWTAASWQHFLSKTTDPAETKQIRNNTHTGRPLGSDEFVRHVEQALCRELAPRKGGRRRKHPIEPSQEVFEFANTTNRKTGGLSPV
jgi:putative transposase